MQLIDTHVHINFEAFKDDIEAVRSRWREAGVVRLVHSCVSPEEFVGIQAIADRFEEVSFAVGLHPLDAHKWTNSTASQILELASSDKRVCAIGETGLDFYKADNTEQQVAAFKAQLHAAQQLNKPVIIHCRDAAAPMAEMLREFWLDFGPVRGVMHCWGGTPEETQWFLDLGLYISFSGTVTFKKAVQIHESACRVSSDRLLVETDCPFLAPAPNRGKRNEPANVRHVAAEVARIRGVTLETISQQTTKNACQLFNLSEPKYEIGDGDNVLVGEGLNY